ncbi:hypothetical protein J8J40_34315, partial [Mycobacterium tuberculosis]|nr:hypothetical protein [Mycobacterium tuberculosis]
DKLGVVSKWVEMPMLRDLSWKGFSNAFNARLQVTAVVRRHDAAAAREADTYLDAVSIAIDTLSARLIGAPASWLETPI